MGFNGYIPVPLKPAWAIWTVPPLASQASSISSLSQSLLKYLAN